MSHPRRLAVLLIGLLVVAAAGVVGYSRYLKRDIESQLYIPDRCT